MSKLVFYTNPMSRGRMVRWMLEEVAVDYDTKLVAYGRDMKSEAYRAVNPMGKVPAIVHGDTVVTEVAAICAYLADAFPEAGLAPPSGSAERGDFYRWLFFTAGPTETAIVNRTFGFEIDAEDPNARGRAGWGTYDLVFDTLERHFSDGRDHVLGADFSAADVYIGAQLGWGLQFGTVPERPGFAEYVERVMTRPAAVRARELDDAALAEMG